MVTFEKRTGTTDIINIELSGDKEVYVATLRALVRVFENIQEDYGVLSEDMYYISCLINSMIPNPKQIAD